MSRPQTGLLVPSAPRLLADDRPDQAAKQPPNAQLRPWAALPRLRPVKVETLTNQLSNYERTIIGLRLVEQHFPEALADYGDLAQTGWWEILAHLNNLVEEAGWWEVNWTALNEAWAWWMEESKENGDRLAIFLTYIPVRHYGLNQDTILKFPPMELLYVLLDGSVGVASSDLLIAIELYDGIDQWDQADRDAAWARLHAIEADPGLYPEAVRWLPELARWACHRTGNHLWTGILILRRPLVSLGSRGRGRADPLGLAAGQAGDRAIQTINGMVRGGYQPPHHVSQFLNGGYEP
ncbi:MAG: hypothetical protein HS126_37710 [Anaerolineales bacterium]|nr:hypothetical protein [Anaerolineales bacterium]